MSLNQLTISQVKDGLKTKKFSVKEAVEDCRKRIADIDGKINAFTEVFEDICCDVDLEKPLGGVPIAIKDNFCMVGSKVTASSNVLRNYRSQYTATVVQRLIDAGAVVIGKTNMDAWAHGSSTETSDFGATKNPWNTDHLPGGSSGGTAAAVIADECIAALGSETAGSIRQPAAWTGCVGLKPTYGRCSRYGVIAMMSSTDSPGPLAKCVDDAALMLSVLAGHDPRDATSIDESGIGIPPRLDSLDGLKLGVPKSYFPKEIQKETKTAIENSLKTFEKLGAEIVWLPDMMDPKYSIAVYTILQRSEVSSNLARFDGIRYGNDRSYFGAEAKRRILLGTYTLSAGYYDAYFLKAQKVRSLIVEDFDKQFKKVDAIIGPVSPTTALKVGATEGQSMFGELQDMFLEPSSIAGLPGISLPCGFDKNGLPIGLQIVTPQKKEDLSIQIARMFEENTNYHLKKPKI